MSENEKKPVDAVVIGAGFSGLLSLHKLRNELGLDAVALEKGDGIGGTWFWNRYPGALSDSESFVYCYSFDDELLQDWDLSTRYLAQPEVLAYLRSFAERKGLVEHVELNATVVRVHFDDATALWSVETEDGRSYTARYVVGALGPLSAANIPTIPGIEKFRGEVYHTSNWPAEYDLRGKRVGVIGTGSTGVQVITALAGEVGELTVFQRTPQYSVPLGNRELSDEYVREVKANYGKIWEDVYSSSVGMGFDESTVPAMSVSAEERREVFEKAWQHGGGFYFMFGTFGDIGVDPEANEAAASFIRGKIAEIVEDPETARKLTPTDLYARRPLCDSGYYATFNRPNVHLVDVRDTPIVDAAARGLRTSDGALHELDVLIYATGFDAVEGSYNRIDVRGRGGHALVDHWRDMPRGYLGVAVAGFPNLFTVFGPNSSFSNNPPVLSIQAEWIAEAIRHAAKEEAVLEPTVEAEESWTTLCNEISDGTLFPEVESWIFGNNIEGKSTRSRFYLGGLGAYRDILANEAAQGYQGFVAGRS
ncbi:NAD(P)/FAD-dependent oxidoreductase [Pseudonocardia yuanmonensis]|uniref:NAD(P)/FAD-dependent oxidoreductase n=1 Tax=Pseudonocardia yuanmonensis TaxID=1095914 RepID=A0ABP8WJI8_9PSEU